MPVGGNHFSSVRKARAALMERAHELFDLQVAIIKAAMGNGDFETAAKANQFLIEHVPAEEGERMIDISIDKPQQIEQKNSGPTIQIGFQLGGMPHLLPTAEVIDVVPVQKHIKKADEQ